jgi:hypothetical protein
LLDAMPAIRNDGQVDQRVRFYMPGDGIAFAFAPGEIDVSVHPTAPARATTAQVEAGSQPNAAAMLRISLVGADPAAEWRGIEPLGGTANYFIGNDPWRWHTNVPTFTGVECANVFPGIDLRYSGAPGSLKGTYVVSPGADPSLIRWRYGAQTVHLDRATGALLIDLPPSTAANVPSEGSGVALTEVAPEAWQEANGARVSVAARYVLRAGGDIGFTLGDYDARRPLIIDPTLEFSTYLGGSGGDYGAGIAVDGSGSVYVIGYTDSWDFPTQGALQSDPGNPPGLRDAFVTKLDPRSGRVIYGTYLGGNSDDGAVSIAVDSSGSAYIVGVTSSDDFPTANAIQSSLVGDNASDAFVAKLNPVGNALEYSTYLGGSDVDFAAGVALDGQGNAYVGGETHSADFPTVGAIQTTLGGQQDGFLAEVSSAGDRLLYATYLGGSGLETVRGVAVGQMGNVYLAGATTSADFPVSANAVQPQLSGNLDAFVTVLSATGGAVQFSTYLGGSLGEEAYGIAVDSSGQAYVTGRTASSDFPTKDAFQGRFGGGIPSLPVDAFLTKLAPQSGELVYSTYLGGSDSDAGLSVAVDGAGDAYVLAGTGSADLPVVDSVQATRAGPGDVFVAKFDPSGTELLYSSYLGGSGSEYSIGSGLAGGIAVDPAGNAYITSHTDSPDFPVTANAVQARFGGIVDAFVTMLGAGNVPSPTPTPVVGHACTFAVNRVPAVVISHALANPAAMRGWGERCNPSAPPSPYNVLRTWLSLVNIAAPYHPAFNPLAYKCGCP